MNMTVIITELRMAQQLFTLVVIISPLKNHKRPFTVLTLMTLIRVGANGVNFLSNWATTAHLPKWIALLSAKQI